jgi:pilus assembly protein Flp/PilA
MGHLRVAAESELAAHVRKLCVVGRVIMKNLISRFVKDESGATAIEYGLIAALISVAAIAAVTTVGTNLKTTFNKVSGNMT